MNPYFDALPSVVEIGGREYPVFTDFRAWLEFETLCMDEEIELEDKLLNMVDWYECQEDMPNTLEEAIVGLLWFFRCGNIQSEDKAKERMSKAKHVQPDMKKCLPLIYAAFRQCYGIDLYSANLHWWEYRALLEALPQGTRFADVLSLLAAPVGKETKEQKAYREEVRESFGSTGKNSGKAKTIEERDRELIESAKRRKNRP